MTQRHEITDTTTIKVSTWKDLEFFSPWSLLLLWQMQAVEVSSPSNSTTAAASADGPRLRPRNHVKPDKLDSEGFVNRITTMLLGKFLE